MIYLIFVKVNNQISKTNITRIIYMRNIVSKCVIKKKTNKRKSKLNF